MRLLFAGYTRGRVKKSYSANGGSIRESDFLNLVSRNMQQFVVVYSLPISRVVGKEQCDGEK